MIDDSRGRTEPAEFYAVVTGVFFERPLELAADSADVYGELAGLYGMDPMAVSGR